MRRHDKHEYVNYEGITFSFTPEDPVYGTRPTLVAFFKGFYESATFGATSAAEIDDDDYENVEQILRGRVKDRVRGGSNGR